MSEAFQLAENGDLDVSRNGVIRVLSGIENTTFQSAQMLIGIEKGSYPFIPELGLDSGVIFDYFVEGQTGEESLAEITEYLIKAELTKDPNLGIASNFVFERVQGTREVKVTFEIALSNSIRVITTELG